jgi:hypothetical protein
MIYYVTQYFNGYMARNIEAKSAEEAKSLFIQSTIEDGPAIEKLCNAQLEWEGIETDPDI